MSFSEIELRRHEKTIARFMDTRRPPPHIRDELDLSIRISGQSIEVFEVRPNWQDRTKKMEQAVAKATFVRTGSHWKIFWMRRHLKWHRYETDGEIVSLESVLNVIDQDEFGCFFG